MSPTATDPSSAAAVAARGDAVRPVAARGGARWVERGRACSALLGLIGDGRVPACGYAVGVPAVALVPAGETQGGGTPPRMASRVALSAAAASAAAIGYGRMRGAAAASAAASGYGRMRGPHFDGR